MIYAYGGLLSRVPVIPSSRHPEAAEANVASVSAGLHLKLHMPDEALKLGRQHQQLGDQLTTGFLFYRFFRRFVWLI